MLYWGNVRISVHRENSSTLPLFLYPISPLANNKTNRTILILAYIYNYAIIDQQVESIKILKQQF